MNDRVPMILTALVVGASILLTGKLGHYIYFTLDTSPALLWPPVGIALAAVVLGGYRMWLPIAIANYLLILTSPSNPSLITIAVFTVAYTLQPLIGGYLFRRLNFTGKMDRVREAVSLITIGALVTAVAPAAITATHYLMDTLTLTPFNTWSRIWAGGFFSILVLTPLLTAWVSQRSERFNRNDILQIIVAFFFLIVAIYLTFWTSFPSVNVFITLYLLFAPLLWIGLRFGGRLMSVGIFLLASLGMAGSIIAMPSTVPLPQQLFANELFVILIAPIFLIVATLVEERRTAHLLMAARAKELEDALSKVREEEQAKNEFLAILAHELRNPLAPLLSSLELFRLAGFSSPEKKRLADRMDTSIHTISRLLDDLLDISRLSRKGYKLKKDAQDLLAILKDSVESVTTFIQARGITLTLSLPHEPVWVEADRLRIEQVFINILNNAAKYSVSGGNIHVRCSVEGTSVFVRVQDSGIGIASERMQTIFEPFQHDGRAESKKGGGIGIGLSIAKKLVLLHDGEITAESEGLGRGSTFTVRLPLANNPPASPTQEHISLHEVTPSEAEKKILVVDDNIAAIESMSKLLKSKGYVVHMAYNGKDAETSVTSLKPDGVVLDIGLPDISGYEIATHLRSNGYKGVLIALTGYGQDDDKVRAKNAGFDAHLTKPVSISELNDTLVRLFKISDDLI